MYFALLLRKNFKVLFAAAAVDLAAWGVAALMTNQTPLKLLSESMAESAGGKSVFSGLFTMLFPDDKFFAMATGMFAGTIFFREKIFWLASMIFMATAPNALYLSLSPWIDNKIELFWTTRTIFAVILILLGCLMAKKFPRECARKNFSRQ